MKTDYKLQRKGGTKVMTDKQLIVLLQENPDKGIHKTMQLYGHAVNTICQSMLTGCEEGLVDEAVSETFFKLWKNCSQFSPEGGHSLKSYLYSIARNTAIDMRRKNRCNMESLYEENEQELISDAVVEEEAQKNILKNILHQVIQLLGEPDSCVFIYKYFLCMKNKEIAQKLHIPEKRVENILYRGKGKLKKMLAERGITCYENG